MFPKAAADSKVGKGGSPSLSVKFNFSSVIFSVGEKKFFLNFNPTVLSRMPRLSKL